MEDTLERRALLLHLGRVLQLIVRLGETTSAPATIGEFIACNPILEDNPLLARLPATLLVDEFRTRALRAFCLWPQWLLEDPLDRNALAESVHDHLFSDTPRGWRAYASALHAEVAWFGVSPSGRRRPSRHVEAAPPLLAPDDFGLADRGVTQDVERGLSTAGPYPESVEGLKPHREGRADEQRIVQCE